MAAGNNLAGVAAVGHAVRLMPVDAALVNGMSSHRLDFDDVNASFLARSVPVAAAALALAEQLDASGDSLLPVHVAVYETTCGLPSRSGRNRTSADSITPRRLDNRSCCSLRSPARFGRGPRGGRIRPGGQPGGRLEMQRRHNDQVLRAGKACQNGMLSAR